MDQPVPEPQERAVNSGVIISGGTVNGPVAAGPGARAVQVSDAGPGDAAARIEQLLAELETQARTLMPAQADDVADDVGRLRTEVGHRKPDADGIRLILGRLAKAVAGTATMLADVEAIRELIAQLVH